LALYKGGFVTGSGHVDQAFTDRIRAISAQGLGLSVDVYSPDLIELVSCLTSRKLTPGYLEIFRAATSALEFVKRHLTGVALSYHGEGLWITQPESRDHRTFDDAAAEAAVHLNVLQSPWLNHECATKQMGGYSFGTYLPPLYTPLSAEVVAQNMLSAQAILDTRCRRPDGSTPLFLLEMPPLTYFMAGTIPVAQFFRLITERVPCGLVLDMGHLWTVYRYTGMWRRTSLVHFVQEFLDEFPTDRVVEIHVAGLARHEATPAREIESEPPEWLDAHAAPIPPVLFGMLEQVLAHRSLTNLRGVALEVDTKPIDLIVEEFEQASRQIAPLIQDVMFRGTTMSLWPERSSCSEYQSTPLSHVDRQQLSDDYRRYAKIVSGLAAPCGDEWSTVAQDCEGLERYRTVYLPHEILEWGGALTDMFSESCRGLRQRGIDLGAFVGFWFRESRPITEVYDFFLLKIERFVEFVRERAPELAACAEQEAARLRAAYAEANELATSVSGNTR
jgi:hypothetical protein